MTDNDLTELLATITYKPGYRIVRSGRTVQVSFRRADVFTGEEGIGFGGAAKIAPDATAGDVVRTVFGLYRALEEHECREQFKVAGVQVFSPHITYDALIEAGRHIQGQPEPETTTATNDLEQIITKHTLHHTDGRFAPLNLCSGCGWNSDRSDISYAHHLAEVITEVRP